MDEQNNEKNKMKFWERIMSENQDFSQKIDSFFEYASDTKDEFVAIFEEKIKELNPSEETKDLINEIHRNLIDLVKTTKKITEKFSWLSSKLKKDK